MAIVFLIALFALFFFKNGDGSAAAAPHWNLQQQQQHLNYFQRKSNHENTKKNVFVWSSMRHLLNSSDDRIFFHETSGKMELSFRQNCAIESAALHNPQRPVQIFFQPQQQSNASSAIEQSSAWFRALSRYANVQVIVIDDDALYFKDSPLEDWYTKGEWRNSPYRVQHMADYIRMVTLKKGGGGMYLDLDIITLKSYNGSKFHNFVTARNRERITNAAFHLERDHRLIDAIIKKQSEDYDRDDYVYNGPVVFTLAMDDLCFKGDKNVCTDVHLIIPPYFHPESTTPDDIKETLVQDMFRRTDEPGVAQFLRQIRATSYGVHFHNFYSKHSTIDVAPNSSKVFAVLAAEHCPFTFAAAQQGHNNFFSV